MVETTHPNVDQIETLETLLDNVDRLAKGDRDALAVDIRQRTPWSASLLRLASTVEYGGDVERLRRVLESNEWIERIASTLGRFTSLGMLSMVGEPPPS